MGTPTDLDLFERWAAGEQHAGSALFGRYFAPIERFFRNKVGQAQRSTDLQDDLIQTTFTACLEAKERFRADGSFRSFLFGIAYNVLRKHYERTRRDSRIDFGTVSVHDLAPGPSTIVRERADQTLMLEGLRRLPLELQVVIELFYWESMTAAEIGDALGLPHGTVKTRVRRARQLVRRYIESASVDPQVRAAALERLEPSA